MGSRRYLSLKNIALVSLVLGMMVGCFFVFTALSFDPDAEFHDAAMNLKVVRIGFAFLYLTALFGVAVLILGLVIRGAVDLWAKLRSQP